jgi:hypothetical protein
MFDKLLEAWWEGKEEGDKEEEKEKEQGEQEEEEEEEWTEHSAATVILMVSMLPSSMLPAKSVRLVSQSATSSAASESDSMLSSCPGWWNSDNSALKSTCRLNSVLAEEASMSSLSSPSRLFREITADLADFLQIGDVGRPLCTAGEMVEEDGCQSNMAAMEKSVAGDMMRGTDESWPAITRYK